MHMMERKKHLSTIANDVIRRCSEMLGTSMGTLVEEFDREWEPDQMSGYSRKLVEFCCSKALTVICGAIDEAITDGTFSRFTFDMTLAWETPSSADEESFNECLGKEGEDKEASKVTNQLQDDIPLFYSDLMPLLVDGEASAGEDAFVWLGSLVPLVADRVNGRFTFETLTAPTGNRLHFPAYDKFLKEIHKCIKHLQKQDIPKGVELADDEFILHVEGTAGSQRVVRHIGGASYPGRLTLTNYALYFEASSVVSYEDALKLDLSKETERSVKPTATGPWGAPLFDKAIIYESSELQEGVVLEFPEMTSSTRRNHWLALIKEVMLLHKFLSEFKVESPLEVWEMHARTILGIVRLHAAREMLRIAPPEPKSFLIFALLDELPKGDYVLQELAESVKNFTTGHPCTASSVLRNLNVSQPYVSFLQAQKISDNNEAVQSENVSSLETAIDQVREEAKEMVQAKATAEGLKEEGITESAQILLGLVRPFGRLVPWLQGIITWQHPKITWAVIATSLVVVYKEWIGLVISAVLLWGVVKMIQARQGKIPVKQDKIVIRTGSEQTTMESIVSAQQEIKRLHEMMQQTNIALLKVWSILISKAPKHTNRVMIIMSCCAVLLCVVPFKLILMSSISYGFFTTSRIGKCMQSKEGNRRLREWWDSIPVLPVEVLGNESK
ncbi:uncharacterized protein LOC127252143 [Andrographis paniculata]|uniref:uncharacterized protein LOC127252143 n=1 Tax=Andrographis paniculata TaxID=175694 RepID=UPI0021E700F6|nr:uncharacterized protein LOC127252143 [Andrographis paniculata]